MNKDISEKSCLIEVRAIPNASRNEIIGFEGDILKVKLRAVPEDGKANKELIRFFSKTLTLPKSKIKLERGDKSRHKLIRISGLVHSEFIEMLRI